MNNDDMMNTDRTKRRDGRALTGLFLVVVGGALLVSRMGAPVPRWLFSWETFLIALGVYLGFKHRFRHPFWLVLVFIGSASLMDDAYPLMNLHNYIWPVAIIILGLFFILKPKKIKADSSGIIDSGFQPVETASMDNLVDITAIFSGVKRRILSKNFLGGDITAFMGGAELDLTQADIQGTTVMDITAVFGGIKLIVPPDWDVQSQATAIFGGVEDKRYTHVATQTKKVLILDGVAVFGGIEIKSYAAAAQPM